MLPVVDHMANQSDRWLFIGLLLVVLMSAGWLFKWLISRHDGMATRHEELIKQVVAVVAENKGVIEKNTSALTLMSNHIDWCKSNNK